MQIGTGAKQPLDIQIKGDGWMSSLNTHRYPTMQLAGYSIILANPIWQTASVLQE